MVQEEFKRRKAAGKYTSAISSFASRIVCGDCGGVYGRKLWHSNSKYAKTIWQCNNKFKKRKFCKTPHLDEELVKKAFIDAFNSLIENKEEVLKEYEDIIKKLSDFSKQENELSKIDKKCKSVEKEVKRLIAENARSPMDQDEFNREYNEKVKRYNSLEKRHSEIKNEITRCNGRKNQIQDFIKNLKSKEEILHEFDEGLWSATLNSMIIKSEKEVVFGFKDGNELP
ncbi:zinc ribbon domain-containing protein [Clostridium tarantellae]|uniref:zinc ribbon domain-containing protein n=1 Tax=Clostridium tarantellae TaxID=39493 RepID=UPI001F260D67|nr:zinc ribbon domain-containing protein [Clostridium tarantellae]